MQVNYLEGKRLVKNDFLKILHSDVVIVSLDGISKKFLLNECLTCGPQVIKSDAQSKFLLFGVKIVSSPITAFCESLFKLLTLASRGLVFSSTNPGVRFTFFIQ